MKSTNRYLSLIVLLLVFSGCASSGGGTSPDGNSSSSVEVNNPTMDLADYLRQVSGVNVTGNGASAKVTIRGQNSLSTGLAAQSGTNSTPLFVIDDRVIGTNFAQAYQKVRMVDVTSIDVLKGADAGRYGSRGASGVIVINY